MRDETKQELRRIAAENGGILEPAKVVEAARNKKSPLHRHFEWSDGKAAHLYRLEQARHLIRVTVEYLPQRTETTRVFISLSADRDVGGYRTLVDVLGDPGMRAALLADARRDMEAFQRKYSAIEELAEVFRAMEAAVKETAAA